LGAILGYVDLSVRSLKQTERDLCVLLSRNKNILASRQGLTAGQDHGGLRTDLEAAGQNHTAVFPGSFSRNLQFLFEPASELRAAADALETFLADKDGWLAARADKNCAFHHSEIISAHVFSR
jgi:hypothetical protein